MSVQVVFANINIDWYQSPYVFKPTANIPYLILC